MQLQFSFVIVNSDGSFEKFIKPLTLQEAGVNVQLNMGRDGHRNYLILFPEDYDCTRLLEFFSGFIRLLNKNSLSVTDCDLKGGTVKQRKIVIEVFVKSKGSVSLNYTASSKWEGSQLERMDKEKSKASRRLAKAERATRNRRESRVLTEDCSDDHVTLVSGVDSENGELACLAPELSKALHDVECAELTESFDKFSKAIRVCSRVLWRYMEQQRLYLYEHLSCQLEDVRRDLQAIEHASTDRFVKFLSQLPSERRRELVQGWYAVELTACGQIAENAQDLRSRCASFVTSDSTHSSRPETNLLDVSGDRDMPVATSEREEMGEGQQPEASANAALLSSNKGSEIVPQDLDSVPLPPYLKFCLRCYELLQDLFEVRFGCHIVTLTRESYDGEELLAPYLEGLLRSELEDLRKALSVHNFRLNMRLYLVVRLSSESMQSYILDQSPETKNFGEESVRVLNTALRDFNTSELQRQFQRAFLIELSSDVIDAITDELKLPSFWSAFYRADSAIVQALKCAQTAETLVANFELASQIVCELSSQLALCSCVLRVSQESQKEAARSLFSAIRGSIETNIPQLIQVCSHGVNANSSVAGQSKPEERYDAARLLFIDLNSLLAALRKATSEFQDFLVSSDPSISTIVTDIRDLILVLVEAIIAPCSLREFFIQCQRDFDVLRLCHNPAQNIQRFVGRFISSEAIATDTYRLELTKWGFKAAAADLAAKIHQLKVGRVCDRFTDPLFRELFGPVLTRARSVGPGTVALAAQLADLIQRQADMEQQAKVLQRLSVTINVAELEFVLSTWREVHVGIDEIITRFGLEVTRVGELDLVNTPSGFTEFDSCLKSVRDAKAKFTAQFEHLQAIQIGRCGPVVQVLTRVMGEVAKCEQCLAAYEARLKTKRGQSIDVLRTACEKQDFAMALHDVVNRLSPFYDAIAQANDMFQGDIAVDVLIDRIGSKSEYVYDFLYFMLDLLERFIIEYLQQEEVIEYNIAEYKRYGEQFGPTVGVEVIGVDARGHAISSTPLAEIKRMHSYYETARRRQTLIAQGIIHQMQSDLAEHRDAHVALASDIAQKASTWLESTRHIITIDNADDVFRVCRQYAVQLKALYFKCNQEPPCDVLDLLDKTAELARKLYFKALRRKVEEFNGVRLSCRDMAGLLCYRDLKVFSELEVEEMFSHSVNRPASSVVKITDSDKQLSHFVSSDILCVSKETEKVDRITTWVTVADALYRKLDLQGFIAVCAGLHAAGMYKLLMDWLLRVAPSIRERFLGLWQREFRISLGRALADQDNAQVPMINAYLSYYEHMSEARTKASVVGEVQKRVRGLLRPCLDQARKGVAVLVLQYAAVSYEKLLEVIDNIPVGYDIDEAGFGCYYPSLFQASCVIHSVTLLHAVCRKPLRTELQRRLTQKHVEELNDFTADVDTVCQLTTRALALRLRRILEVSSIPHECARGVKDEALLTLVPSQVIRTLFVVSKKPIVVRQNLGRRTYDVVCDLREAISRENIDTMLKLLTYFPQLGTISRESLERLLETGKIISILDNLKEDAPYWSLEHPPSFERLRSFYERHMESVELYKNADALVATCAENVGLEQDVRGELKWGDIISAAKKRVKSEAEKCQECTGRLSIADLEKVVQVGLQVELVLAVELPHIALELPPLRTCDAMLSCMKGLYAGYTRLLELYTNEARDDDEDSYLGVREVEQSVRDLTSSLDGDQNKAIAVLVTYFGWEKDLQTRKREIEGNLVELLCVENSTAEVIFPQEQRLAAGTATLSAVDVAKRWVVEVAAKRYDQCPVEDDIVKLEFACSVCWELQPAFSKSRDLMTSCSTTARFFIALTQARCIRMFELPEVIRAAQIPLSSDCYESSMLVLSLRLNDGYEDKQFARCFEHLQQFHENYQLLLQCCVDNRIDLVHCMALTSLAVQFFRDLVLIPASKYRESFDDLCKSMFLLLLKELRRQTLLLTQLPGITQTFCRLVFSFDDRSRPMLAKSDGIVGLLVKQVAMESDDNDEAQVARIVRGDSLVSSDDDDLYVGELPRAVPSCVQYTGDSAADASRVVEDSGGSNAEAENADRGDGVLSRVSSFSDQFCLNSPPDLSGGSDEGIAEMVEAARQSVAAADASIVAIEAAGPGEEAVVLFAWQEGEQDNDEQRGLQPQ